MKSPLLPLALALLLPLAACGSGRDTAEQPGEAAITVLAASSLTGAFTDLAEQFEADHPGVTVTLSFGSSAMLARQAAEGAPADVLATADTATMDSATSVQADSARIFATNTMVLVTPAGNPAGITGIGDLAKQSITYVVCVDTAPCGKVAAALLDDNGITRDPASLDVDVKAVLASVTGDEADAGLVYRTDAVSAGGDVTVIEVPHAEDEVTSYPIVPLVQSQHPDLAREFVDLVTSTGGQQLLADAGFGAP